MANRVWILIGTVFVGLAFQIQILHAIIQGSQSGLGSHTVQIAKRGHVECSGVAIDRNVVVTAAHCVRGSTQVIANGVTIAISGRARAITLANGVRVRVAGDAVILRLRNELPFSIAPIPVGDGQAGDGVTVAGYGTVNEKHPGAVGALHQAHLVPARGRLLVDPSRSGKISASACFGDSGGPVVRNGFLVGVITRANYPGARIACGWYTQWAPVMASGHATSVATHVPAADRERGTPTAADPPTLFGAFISDGEPKLKRTRKYKRARHAKRHARRHGRR